MKPRKQSLSKRRYDSAYHIARYWSEPETRLAKINRARVWHGLEPLASIDEVRTNGRRA
jgi:hypothetical protein